jgi:hypothetical protein
MASFTLTSETLSTKSNLKDLFLFLSDFKNFGSILPEDKVENFTHTENRCDFTIKGVTTIGIVMKDKHAFSHLVFNSEGLAKFNFQLTVHFIGQPELIGQCKVELLADMNPIIKMMAEKPLQQLINTMSTKLSQLELPINA